MNNTIFSSSGATLTVTRIFNAPLKIVWRAWTEAELLDQWWAPNPWRSETKWMDFKEGGSRLYAMVGPNGEKHWGLTEYTSIKESTSFKGTDAFCDEEGVKNPNFPESSFSNLFHDLEGKTEVTLITTYASEKDLKTVLEMGMKEGLTKALENLDKVLAKIPSKQ